MIIRAMMEAASTSETSINFYHTTRRNMPEDNNFHARFLFVYHLLIFLFALFFLLNYLSSFMKLHIAWTPNMSKFGLDLLHQQQKEAGSTELFTASVPQQHTVY
jgi:hypothetical protein